MRYGRWRRGNHSVLCVRGTHEHRERGSLFPGRLPGVPYGEPGQEAVRPLCPDPPPCDRGDELRFHRKRRDPGPRSGAENPQRGILQRRKADRGLRAGSPADGFLQPPECRPRPDHRQGVRAVLHCDGVCPRRALRAPDPGKGPDSRGGASPARHPGGGRAQGSAGRRFDPPGHQAGQYPARFRGKCQDRRFRPGSRHQQGRQGHGIGNLGDPLLRPA